METVKESIAAVSAIAKSDLVPQRCSVATARFEAERTYRVALSIVGQMLSDRLIAGDEAASIDTKLRSIFCPISGGLYR